MENFDPKAFLFQKFNTSNFKVQYVCPICNGAVQCFISLGEDYDIFPLQFVREGIILEEMKINHVCYMICKRKMIDKKDQNANHHKRKIPSV